MEGTAANSTASEIPRDPTEPAEATAHWHPTPVSGAAAADPQAASPASVSAAAEDSTPAANHISSSANPPVNMLAVGPPAAELPAEGADNTAVKKEWRLKPVHSKKKARSSAGASSTATTASLPGHDAVRQQGAAEDSTAAGDSKQAGSKAGVDGTGADRTTGSISKVEGGEASGEAGKFRGLSRNLDAGEGTADAALRRTTRHSASRSKMGVADSADHSKAHTVVSSTQSHFKSGTILTGVAPAAVGTAAPGAAAAQAIFSSIHGEAPSHSRTVVDKQTAEDMDIVKAEDTAVTGQAAADAVDSAAKHGSGAQHDSRAQHASAAQHNSRAQLESEAQYGSRPQLASEAQHRSGAQHASLCRPPCEGGCLQLGEALKGHRIQVWWSGELQYFAGVVTAFSNKNVSLCCDPS